MEIVANNDADKGKAEVLNNYLEYVRGMEDALIDAWLIRAMAEDA